MYKVGIIKVNFLIDSLIGLLFIISCLSGVMLIYIDNLLWLRVHSSSSILLVFVAVVHLTLHWKWVIRMTKKVFYLKVTPQKSETPIP